MEGQNNSDFDAEYDSAVEWYVSQFDNDAVKEDFKLTKEQEKSRFAAPVDQEELREIQKSRVPKNTQRATNWGVSVWDSWGRNRNTGAVDTGVASSDLFTLVPALSSDIEHNELCFWLCRFVVEVRQQDRSKYPSQSRRLPHRTLWQGK